jgi:diacylglycerol O-acyltransferase
MTVGTYERLSSQDNSFLLFEQRNTPMNIGGSSIFERGPLGLPGGGVDIDKIRAHFLARLGSVPRYRQRLSFTPVLGHPVWVDDGRFNIRYHLRHTRLPSPGNEEQLKEVSARILSQPLDRRKPLWEMWVIEGLDGDRFAMIHKTHHCVVDGVSGIDLFAAMMRTTPECDVEEPRAWVPRPSPSAAELLVNEMAYRSKVSLSILRTMRDAARDPGTTVGSARENAAVVWRTLTTGLRAAAETPLNGRIGPNRRSDWFALDMADVKAVKNRFGAKVNDVVLAAVAGGVRRYLEHRGVQLRDMDFRAVVPVNIRTHAERMVGNQVSAWITSLPIHERHPEKRIAEICRQTTYLRTSNQAAGISALSQVADLGDQILSLGVRLVRELHPYNMIVTNVAGPPFPLYLLGSRLLAGYPVVPLFDNQGLGIALLSYAGQLFWGFNADWDLVADLPVFVDGVRQSFHELCDAPQAIRLRGAENRGSGKPRGRVPALRRRTTRKRPKVPVSPNGRDRPAAAAH